MLLGKIKKQNYTFSIGVNRNTSPISTNFKAILEDNSSNSLGEFINDFTYQANRFFNEASYLFFIRKWRFILLHSISFLEQKLNSDLQEQRKSRSTFFFEPSVNVFRKLNTISSVSFSYNYSQKPFSEEYFFRNPIFTSIRQTNSNTPDLQFSKIHSTSLNYAINDSYKQFLFIIGTNYIVTQGNYFSDLSIEPTRTQISFFFLPQNTNALNTYLNTEKFFYRALILLKFNANYGFQTFNNIINNSELRSNEIQTFSSKFEVKTAFKSKINFQNAFSFGRMVSGSVGGSSFVNENLNNSFSIIFKKNKQSHILITADCFVPNAKKINQNYLFLDAQYNLVLKNNNLNIDFVVKNILNVSNFEQISTTDYSENIFRSNLLPRYGILRVSCSF